MNRIVSLSLEEKLADGAEFSPELEQLMRRAREASDFLKALSHESRLIVLCLLAEKERSVSDLERILSLRQPTISQQLARLRDDRLVKTRRDGNTIYYSLASEEVRQVIALVYSIYCKPGLSAADAGD
ncbi:MULTISPECIES: ArsR/SmtB family transcription factor [Hyphomicrobiales]|jgi:DNA-binding transcriptional ArsR family regulator|uniref:ArsR family transcriptional regulator n=2 Tax=Prosthecodimorpha TaxID=2981530 RepID=A0A0P6VM34_9HYPH|nr:MULTISPECIES: metalloregulator ArsR/SmtB family transcription factor [Hyphomicrobiales]KPL53699.1 ArsR family transcriptional regulator [Prosthecomicrobium hirschii]MBT9289531.1 metalloregulator ArsR/SmtB family transcription factor [Prosthecodimorpha staleyi]MCW1842815.1 metalloregulator ArsR/SmtB family transcription factor [Prosthecomicrobium hirschii]TPQ50443.1 transcriptional regulator [Prosthecomicrobium hirschii]